MYNQYDDYEPEPRDPYRYQKGNVVVGGIIIVIIILLKLTGIL